MQTQTNCCYNKKMEINTGGVVCLLCNETFKGVGKAGCDCVAWIFHSQFLILRIIVTLSINSKKRVKKSKEVAIKRGPTQKDVTTEVNVIT